MFEISAALNVILLIVILWLWRGWRHAVALMMLLPFGTKGPQSLQAEYGIYRRHLQRGIVRRYMLEWRLRQGEVKYDPRGRIINE